MLFYAQAHGFERKWRLTRSKQRLRRFTPHVLERKSARCNRLLFQCLGGWFYAQPHAIYGGSHDLPMSFPGRHTVLTLKPRPDSDTGMCLTVKLDPTEPLFAEWPVLCVAGNLWNQPVS